MPHNRRPLPFNRRRFPPNRRRSPANAVGYPPTAVGCPTTAVVVYPRTAVGCPTTAVGHPTTAVVGYPPTAVGYPPTAVGYPPTAVVYPPTAVGYPPTAVGYPPTAVGSPPTGRRPQSPSLRGKLNQKNNSGSLSTALGNRHSDLRVVAGGQPDDPPPVLAAVALPEVAAARVAVARHQMAVDGHGPARDVQLQHLRPVLHEDLRGGQQDHPALRQDLVHEVPRDVVPRPEPGPPADVRVHGSAASTGPTRRRAKNEEYFMFCRNCDIQGTMFFIEVDA